MLRIGCEAMPARLTEPPGSRDSAAPFCYPDCVDFPDPFRALRKRGRTSSFGRPDKRRRRRPDLDQGGVPVEPDKPKNLSGGAAAALEFDDEAEV